MPRTHGYSEKGKPCVGQQDWHQKGRRNALGALIGKTLLTVCWVHGSVNADVFYAGLTQDLLPKMPSKAVIVMDNASFHKRQDILDAIQESGTLLEFLPPYSPDLNPIELKWAQAKAIRREHGCSVDELFKRYL